VSAIHVERREDTYFHVSKDGKVLGLCDTLDGALQFVNALLATGDVQEVNLGHTKPASRMNTDGPVPSYASNNAGGRK